jgi:glucose-6-phosphate dehydrogenase assembly protein OpcA
MEKTVSASPGQVLAELDQQLRAFWSSPSAPGEVPKARACTRNLVVVAGTPDLADRWVSVVDDVLQVVPARAIVVGLDPDGPDALAGTSTAVCTPGVGGGPAVCSERVTLLARGAVCARLASCIETLSVTDVPTTLVWLGHVHADDLVFAPIARGADRIILDAAQASLFDLARVVRWADGGGRSAAGAPSPGVADLAWTRLAPWQELCARLFDEPRVRGLAQKVTRVGIAQAGEAGFALGSEGMLMLGWLATRLEWKAVSLAGKLRLVRPDQVNVQTHLGAEPAAHAPQGALLALKIEAGAGDLSLRGTIARERADADTAIWSLDTTCAGDTRHIEQRVRLRASEPARLLERTIHRPPYDRTLAESVAWADGLLGEELACGK